MGDRTRAVTRLRAAVAATAALAAITAGAHDAEATEAISTGASATTVAEAVAADPGTVTGAAFLTQASPVTAGTTSAAIGGLPNAGSSYGVLSTGDAGLLDEPNIGGGSGSDVGGGPSRGNTDFDVTVLRIDVNVPTGINCLVGMDFRFLSEEYPEYVGSSYNDAFVAELDQSTWTTAGSEIQAPNNFAFDPTGNPITINAAGITSMNAAEAAGTTFDGATPLLRARTPIAPGAHSIYLSIFDQGDHVLDSAVIIDNLRFGLVSNLATDCKPGATPTNSDIRYVALGDSYSSGQGTFNYDLHRRAQRCHRGPEAWPRYIQQGVDGISEIEHKACTGAKAPQLLETYLDNPPQVDVGHVENDVDLVTLTVGGNDAGFAGIIAECYRPGDSCADVHGSANFQAKLRRLTLYLDNVLYPAIRDTYPNARIVHVGYPRITPRPGTTPVNCGWLSAPEQQAGVDVAADLNFAIQQAAFLSSDDVEFLSVTDALTGRELCTDDPWVAPIASWSTGIGTGNEQGHPTSKGQDAIAALVAFQLGYMGYDHQA